MVVGRSSLAVLCVVLSLLKFDKASSAPVPRLIINGSRVLDPYNDGQPIVLNGFDWYLPYTDGGDGSLQKSLIPNSNVVRLVGIFWDNSQSAEKDCRSANASEGFLKPSCLQDILQAIDDAAAAGLWVVVCARSEYAAGQDPSNNVFTNSTLRANFLTMWSFVASKLASVPRVAAYEIMSEPRVKNTPDSVVAKFMADGCSAVHAVDPRTPCMVGPAPYYKPWKLTDTYLLPPSAGPALYTVDFFIPSVYVQSTFAPTYTNNSFPGIYECDVAFAGWASLLCPSGAHALINVNASLLEHLIVTYPVSFREKHQVPVLVNQWGVKRAVSDDRGRLVYAEALLQLMAQYELHSAYWIFHWYGKSSGDHWGGFEVVHHWNNGTVSVDHPMLDVFNGVWGLQ